jgi:hypothetical protein
VDGARPTFKNMHGLCLSIARNANVLVSKDARRYRLQSDALDAVWMVRRLKLENMHGLCLSSALFNANVLVAQARCRCCVDGAQA